MLIGLLIAAVIVVGAGQAGFLSSQPPSDLGVHNGLLKPPSKTQNSVSSQAHLHDASTYEVEYARIAPFKWPPNPDSSVDLTPDAALAKLKVLIEKNFPEARLMKEDSDYLRYEFQTALMKFTDDVEFLFVPTEKQIHVRSASRLGRSDLGKNRNRIEKIRKIFE